MADNPAPTPAPLVVQSQRERTVVALCDHFAHDNLTLEEFERRLDVANRALTVPELESLLSDLPAAAPTSAPSAAPSHAAMPTQHIREQQTLVAVMGGVERRGRWQPARNTLVVCAMGGGMLDFREVQLPPGETEVTIVCIMGGCEIITPPGMNVDTGGLAIMGGFAHRHDLPPSNDPNAPLLRITGFALMGGVDLQVRLPGETGRDASQRIRDERKRLRDERHRR
ncbi:MAG TPA: DUF1707 domain-containing protein [Longimicrobiales bacterium]|nr:DUF1707 domain-containing protein [Longimicrobiales bacterium]